MVSNPLEGSGLAESDQEREEEMKTTSDIFQHAFTTNSSGCHRVCKCGRTHFDSTYDGWDEGEGEELLKKAQATPDLFIATDHFVGTYIVAGVEYVCDCPCGGPVEIEELLVKQGKQVAEYLNLRAAEENSKEE